MRRFILVMSMLFGFQIFASGADREQEQLQFRFSLGYGNAFRGIPATPRRCYRAADCDQPGPRTMRPGLAPVCSPFNNTGVPLTNTCSIPVAYWCGFSKVA
jgi:hypothetical protein